MKLKYLLTEDQHKTNNEMTTLNSGNVTNIEFESEIGSGKLTILDDGKIITYVLPRNKQQYVIFKNLVDLAIKKFNTLTYYDENGIFDDSDNHFSTYGFEKVNDTFIFRH